MGVAFVAGAFYAIGALTARGGAASYVLNETVSSHVMSPAAVADKVTKQLATMGTATPKILSLTVTTGDRVTDFQADAGKPQAGSAEASAVVWLVRAEGSFVGMRVPPGAKPITSTTGYFLIDDATGEVVGMGMP